MENKADLENALSRLKTIEGKYNKTSRYYKGEHDLAFATDKFKNAFGSLFREFALNLCPAVCDAPKDKLRITNFQIESGDESIQTLAWQIWQNNRMAVRAAEVHKEALLNGDAYVIVWSDPDGRVTIYPQKASKCTVFYDEETPGKILWAAKTWAIKDTSPKAQPTDTLTRLNLYYPDRIERYVSKKASKALPTRAEEMQEFTPEDGSSVTPNPYGVVPVFHFGNNADIGSFGSSELDSVIPIQNALNKSVLDMMVAMEFAAFRQRWASGIEIEHDAEGNAIPPFTAGVERLWTTDSTEAKFGDFDSSDLKQFLGVKRSFAEDIASVSGTPIYYLLAIAGDFPSGEALKKSETRFLNKVQNRMETFGSIWEDVMQFGLLIEGKKDIRLFTEWQEPAPVSERELLDNIVVKKEGIGISEKQALIEAGYGEADIERMANEKAADAETAADRFNAGNIEPIEPIDTEL
jgi:hypothetical protein